MNLTTERLILRPWLDSDAPSLYELARDPRIGTAAGWPPHESMDQSLAIVRNVLRGPEQYAITLRENGRLIGAIGLKTHNDCDYLQCDVDYSVGYWIGAPYQGNGFATEALKTLIEHACNDLHACTIYADHFLDNSQSHRVMEKCGLSPVGTRLIDVPYPVGKREVLIMRRKLSPNS